MTEPESTSQSNLPTVVVYSAGAVALLVLETIRAHHNYLKMMELKIDHELTKYELALLKDKFNVLQNFTLESRKVLDDVAHKLTFTKDNPAVHKAITELVQALEVGKMSRFNSDQIILGLIQSGAIKDQPPILIEFFKDLSTEINKTIAKSNIKDFTKKSVMHFSDYGVLSRDNTLYFECLGDRGNGQYAFIEDMHATIMKDPNPFEFRFPGGVKFLGHDLAAQPDYLRLSTALQRMGSNSEARKELHLLAETVEETIQDIMKLNTAHWEQWLADKRALKALNDGKSALRDSLKPKSFSRFTRDRAVAGLKKLLGGAANKAMVGLVTGSWIMDLWAAHDLIMGGDKTVHQKPVDPAIKVVMKLSRNQQASSDLNQEMQITNQKVQVKSQDDAYRLYDWIESVTGVALDGEDAFLGKSNLPIKKFEHLQNFVSALGLKEGESKSFVIDGADGSLEVTLTPRDFNVFFETMQNERMACGTSSFFLAADSSRANIDIKIEEYAPVPVKMLNGEECERLYEAMCAINAAGEYVAKVKTELGSDGEFLSTQDKWVWLEMKYYQAKYAVQEMVAFASQEFALNVDQWRTLGIQVVNEGSLLVDGATGQAHTMQGTTYKLYDDENGVPRVAITHQCVDMNGGKSLWQGQIIDREEELKRGLGLDIAMKQSLARLPEDYDFGSSIQSSFSNGTMPWDLPNKPVILSRQG